MSAPPLPAGFTKYKLADHRYGREEMLALFPPNSTMVDELSDLPFIAIEKAQHPLAFLPPSEDEMVRIYSLEMLAFTLISGLMCAF